MLGPEGNPVKIIALIATVAAFSNFLEGYSSSYPNTASDSFREFINQSYISHGRGILTYWSFTWMWSLLLNIWFIGYLAGTIFTPFVTDTYGRKNGLLLGNGISLLGTLFVTSGIYFRTPELLIVGRLVSAIGSGLSFGSLILFIQETTPTNLRGTCSFLSEVSYIAVNVIGMGMGMDLLLGCHLLALVGFGALPGLLSILIVLPLKESPKFLLINRNDCKAAQRALDFYQGVQHDNHSTFLCEIMKEADLGKKGDLTVWKAVLEVIKQPHLLKAVAIGTLSLQITVGIWPIIYISTDLLEAHFNANASQYSSFAFICANFVASIFGTFSVEKFGRRPMLIWFGAGNTFCLCAYILFDRMTSTESILYVNNNFKYGCIVSLIFYGITYGISLGPIAFFITSELVPQRFRSLVQSIVFMMNTVINFVFSFITLPLYELIDVWSFIPLFIVPSTVAIIYLIKELPETKGREIHEIVEQLKRGSKDTGKNISIEPPSTSMITGSATSFDNPAAEEQIPVSEILFGKCGHGKHSLIKTATGGITRKMTTGQQISIIFE